MLCNGMSNLMPHDGGDFIIIQIFNFIIIKNICYNFIYFFCVMNRMVCIIWEVFDILI